MIYRILLLVLIVLEFLAITELHRHKRSFRKIPDDKTRKLIRLTRIEIISGAALITLLTVIISRH